MATEIEIVLTGGSATLRVDGSLFLWPRKVGDNPVEPHVIATAAAPGRATTERGWNILYFAFSGHQADDEFTIAARHRGAPASFASKPVKTQPTSGRTFRFKVL